MESKHEQIVVALQERLSQIPGDGGVNYWYTPDRILRASFFGALCLDSSLSTVYVLSPEDVTDEQVDSCTAKALLRVNLTALHKYEPATENPFEHVAPIRWTIQTRLERDVKKLIRSDVSLGSLAMDCRVPLTSYAPSETLYEGWACVFMRLEIKYHYSKATP